MISFTIFFTFNMAIVITMFLAGARYHSLSRSWQRFNVVYCVFWAILLCVLGLVHAGSDSLYLSWLIVSLTVLFGCWGYMFDYQLDDREVRFIALMSTAVLSLTIVWELMIHLKMILA